MNKQLMTLTAIAIGAISFAAAGTTAQAATLGPVSLQAAQAVTGEVGVTKVGFRHRRHRRFHRFHYKPYYGYHYGRGCYWLKKKAIYTGSHYWWKKYRYCRHGGY